MEGVPAVTTGNAGATKAEGAAAMPPPPPVSPPALTPAPSAGEEGPPPLPEAGAPGCSGSRPPELEPERSLGRLRSRFEDEEEELEEDEDLDEEEEEEEEEEMSHFSLRLEGGRPDSEDEEEVSLAPVRPCEASSVRARRGLPLAAAAFGTCVDPPSLRCLPRLVVRTGLPCQPDSLPTHFVRFLQSLRLSGSDLLIIETTARGEGAKGSVLLPSWSVQWDGRGNSPFLQGLERMVNPSPPNQSLTGKTF